MKWLYRERLERKLAAMKTGLSSPYGAATLSVAAGELEQAIEFLERAYDERDPMLVAVKTEPAFDPLREDLRFTALLKRIGLKDR